MNIFSADTGQHEAEAGKPPAKFSSRKFRFWAQVFSSAMLLWIGYEFYRFINYIETPSAIGPVPVRPPGVEGFLPISGLISLRDWFISGSINTIHPASLIILLVIIAGAFLFKKSFCSWVCPVGFISEMIADLNDKVTGLRMKLPVWLDYPFRSLKYIILLFFAYAVFWSMSDMDIRVFIESPYNKVADIKMLHFFTDMDAMGLWIMVGLFAGSIILRGFWCRYLCPYGALLGLTSLLGIGKIKRNEDICISCGECAKACPSFIKVDQIKTVVSDECSGCLDCIDVCPEEGSLELFVAPMKKKISPKVWVWAVVILFWGGLTLFKLTGPWQNSITTEEYRHHSEQMKMGRGYGHPGR